MEKEKLFFAEFYYKGDLVLSGPGNGKNLEDAEMQAGWAAMFKAPWIIYDTIKVHEIKED